MTLDCRDLDHQSVVSDSDSGEVKELAERHRLPPVGFRDAGGCRMTWCNVVTTSYRIRQAREWRKQKG